MRYKNSRTGAVIDSSFKISGGDWIRVDEQPVKNSIVSDKMQTVVETEKEDATSGVSDDLADVTKKEIMQELDAMGIKYDSRAKKQELYDLMNGE
ncbi:hypothetical protein AUF12_05325 [Enterococcus avium]|uniref:hypothetical protein n=1 Tax=Enterococcus avium TaxID=33945 RepID=UPI000C9CBC53|nr:hypothetical protein [Enterococcus avium]MDT2565142.1 hypothetical protein [Enterococcus avium]PNE49958.1 hypothetical protein AUF12_05325 [Enterococcus avium]